MEVNWLDKSLKGKGKGKKGKGGKNDQGRGKSKGQAQSGWKKFDGQCRHRDRLGHTERGCWWKNADNAEHVPRLILHSCDRVPFRCCHQLPRLLRVKNEALYVSEEVPRGPWLFSLDYEQDSERQDAEENHLSRADDDIVVDTGAAVSSAS